MLPERHALFGFLFCLLLYFFNFPVKALILIFIANIAIDIDHYIIYGINKKSWNFLKAYRFFVNLVKLKKPGKFYLCIFHTIEFLLVLFILAILLKSNYLFLIFVGFSFHTFVDFVDMLRMRKRFKENILVFFSCIARVIKRKNERKKKKAKAFKRR